MVPLPQSPFAKVGEGKRGRGENLIDRRDFRGEWLGGDLSDYFKVYFGIVATISS